MSNYSPAVVVSYRCGYALTRVETGEYHMWMNEVAEVEVDVVIVVEEGAAPPKSY
jgi:hypothetical protein